MSSLSPLGTIPTYVSAQVQRVGCSVLRGAPLGGHGQREESTLRGSELHQGGCMTIIGSNARIMHRQRIEHVSNDLSKSSKLAAKNKSEKKTNTESVRTPHLLLQSNDKPRDDVRVEIKVAVPGTWCRLSVISLLCGHKLRDRVGASQNI